MAKYVTKQRKIMLDFLKQHTDETLCAKQIAELLCSEISVSAVYRNLATLENEGIVKRISKPGSREVYFRLSASPECNCCFHLSCKECGKTFHMNHEKSEKLLQTVVTEDGFCIDKSNTVLYGICKNCRATG